MGGVDSTVEYQAVIKIHVREGQLDLKIIKEKKVNHKETC